MMKVSSLVPRALCFSSLLLTLGFLSGCGESKQSSAGSAGVPKEKSDKAKAVATTRVEKVERPAAPSPLRSTPTPAATASAAGESKSQQTTQTAAAEPTPPSAISEVLGALDKIPVTITDHVTTDQVDQVVGALHNLDLRFQEASLYRSDADQAYLEESVEKFAAMARELLEARSPEELREKYRQLSEALKLFHAEMQERARQWDEKHGLAN